LSVIGSVKSGVEFTAARWAANGFAIPSHTSREGGPAVKRAGLVRWWCLAWPIALAGWGCSLAPKSFRDMLAPAPIVRARAVGLGDNQPEWVAVPAMLDRLNDPDPVVRMTVNDTLKKRTRQDFAFVPWGPADERKLAVDRWRTWWSDRSAQAAYPKDDELRKVSVQPDRKRRKRRSGGGQGGPTSWPSAAQSPPQPSTDPTLGL